MPAADCPHLIDLTSAERATLLRLARDSIRGALAGVDVPRLDTSTPALQEHCGTFVSLHDGPRLRGCVGTVLAERPLHESVARVARSAAFDDPRFPALTAAELARMTIEISRLSRLVPAVATQVQPGVHGVCIERGEQRAVFLPQVAPAHHWNRDTLLTELCTKALLPGDAWKHTGVTLMIFVAEVFAEGAGGLEGLGA